MQCTSCGTPFPPGTKYCPSCGTPTPTPDYSPGTFQESASSSPNQPSNALPPTDFYAPGTFQEGPSPQNNPAADKTVPAGSSHPTTPVTPGAPVILPQNTFDQPPYTPPQPQQPQQLYYAQRQPPFVGVPSAYNQQQTPPFPPPRQAPPGNRRRLSRGLVIALVVLALLLMGSGFALIYYSTVYHPNQLHAQATGTAQTLQTRVANATATANTQATGTAVAIVNATSTANAVATANVVGTATALQNIYTQATSGGSALNNSLSGNTGSNWDVDQAQGGGGCAFTGGTYHASLFAKGFYFPCIAQNTNFSNFAFQVQMNITRGDFGGLIFRGNSSAVKFYGFRIGVDGTYNLFVSQDSTHSASLLFGTSPAFKRNAGQNNLIAVIARGSTIYFYINRQYVGSVSDSTLKSGQIGVFAEDHTNPTDVAFSNLQVWQL